MFVPSIGELLRPLTFWPPHHLLPLLSILSIYSSQVCILKSMKAIKLKAPMSFNPAMNHVQTNVIRHVTGEELGHMTTVTTWRSTTTTTNHHDNLNPNVSFFPEKMIHYQKY